MENGRGLNSWQTCSYIEHAVASDPLGTFVKADVALPAWAHNAAPVRAPASHAACPGCFYLFHIGDGVPRACGEAESVILGEAPCVPFACNTTCDPATATPCCEGLGACAYDPVFEDHRCLPLPPKICTMSSEPTAGGAEHIIGHRSASPAGPWIPLAGSGAPSCNNPAPAFARNGTLFVVCNSGSVYRADKDPAVAAGAWTFVTDIALSVPAGAEGYVRIEDGYLYQARPVGSTRA